MFQHLNFKKASLLFAVLCVAILVQAQAPAGYYSAAKGKKGSAVKTALFSIVSSHTQRSYNQLWEDFKKTDVRSDGKIRDRYSNKTNYTPGGSAQGSNYKGEGDSYNREHSFPKSWFNEGTPMYTDLFHLYPTDGYVNGRRSNYPFGENNGEKYSSSGGYSKLGACTVSGYTGICFEPADEYKGDFARTYFYMATAYEDRISSWSSPMLSGNKYPAYKTWAIDMLLRWAQEDPVSQVEIDRNNAVYGIQHNRNPYIDYPGLEQYVWGAYKDYAFDPDNYVEKPGGTDPQPGEVAAPVFSPAEGKVKSGTVVTVSTTTAGASICYSIDGGTVTTALSPVQFTVDRAMTVTAYAELAGEKSASVSAKYTLKEDNPDVPQGDDVYVLVTDESDLYNGATVLIVCPGKNVAMAEQDDDIRAFAEVEVDGSTQSVKTEVGGSGQPVAFTLSGDSEGWSFKDTTDGTYLALTAKKKKLYSLDEENGSQTKWTVTVSGDGIARIVNNAFSGYSIQYNSSSPRFACYTSTQQEVALYRKSVSSGIKTAAYGKSAADVHRVYDLQGRVVRTVSGGAPAFSGLPAGVYIYGGRKIVVK